MDTSSAALDPGAAILDPAFLEKIACVPSCAEYAKDPGFVRTLRELQAQAAEDPEKAGQIVARQGSRDPRIMACVMALQGVSVEVTEADLKKAEREGDMARRDPVNADLTAEASQCR